MNRLLLKLQYQNTAIQKDIHGWNIISVILVSVQYWRIPYRRFVPKPSEKNSGMPRSVLRHHKHCACDYQGALLSSHLRYWNKAISLQIYKKYYWQCASAELVICTAHIEECRVEPRALLHAFMSTCVAGKNNIICWFQPWWPNCQIWFPIKFSAFMALYDCRKNCCVCKEKLTAQKCKV